MKCGAMVGGFEWFCFVTKISSLSFFIKVSHLSGDFGASNLPLESQKHNS